MNIVSPLQDSLKKLSWSLQYRFQGKKNVAAIGFVLFLVVTLGALVVGFKYFRGDFRGKAAIPPITITMYMPSPPAAGTVTSSPNMGYETKRRTGSSTFVASKKSSLFATIGGGSSSTVEGTYLGMRFSGLSGLENYNIAKAYLEVVPQVSSTAAISFQISADPNVTPFPFDSNVDHFPSNRVSGPIVTPTIGAWTAGVAVRMDVTAPVLQAARPGQSMLALIVKSTQTPAATRKIYSDWNQINAPKLILELTPKSSNVSLTLPIVYYMNLANNPAVYLESDVVYEYAYNGNVVFPRTNAGSSVTTSKIGSWNQLTGTGPFRSLYTGFRFGKVEPLAGETQTPPTLSSILQNYTISNASLNLTSSAAQSAQFAIEIYGESNNAPGAYSSQTNYDDVSGTLQTSLDENLFATVDKDTNYTLDTTPTLSTSMATLSKDLTSGFSFKNTNKPSQRVNALTAQKAVFPTSGQTLPNWALNQVVQLNVTNPVVEAVGSETPDEIGLIAIGTQNAQRTRNFFNDLHATATRHPKLVLTFTPKPGFPAIPSRTISLATKTRISSESINENGTTVTPKATTQVDSWIGSNNAKGATGQYEGYLGMRFCCTAEVPSGYRFSSAELVLVPSINKTTPINFEIRAEKNATVTPDVFSLINLPSKKLAADLTSAATTSLTTANAWKQYVPVSFPINDQFTQSGTSSLKPYLSLIIKGNSTTTAKFRNFYSLSTSTRYRPVVKVTLVPVNPPPTITLSALPLSLSTGQQTTLSWTTSNATGCNASSAPAGVWSGTVAVNSTGVSVGPISQDTTFTLNCNGAGGSNSQSIVVTFTPRPTVTLSASPSSLSTNGTTLLSWTSTNATSCTASASPANALWAGSITPLASGSKTSSTITATTSFTLTCTGPGGSNSAIATVEFNTVPPSVPPSAPPSSAKRVNVAVVRYTGVNPAASLLTFLDQSMNSWITQIENASKFHGYSNASAPATLDVVVSPQHIITRNQNAPNLNDSFASLNNILTTNNNELCNIVNYDNIDQVWYFMAPGANSGPGGFSDESYWSDSQQVNGIQRLCGGTRTFVVITANGDPSRPTSNLHTFGHFMEGYLQVLQTPDLFINRFAGLDYNIQESAEGTVWGVKAVPPYNRLPSVACGNVHYNPTATINSEDYDHWVQSKTSTLNICENWGPDYNAISSTLKKTISCANWGCTNSAANAECNGNNDCYEKYYFNWWFNNMPNKSQNLMYSGKRIPTWMELVGDIDATITSYIDQGYWMAPGVNRRPVVDSGFAVTTKKQDSGTTMSLSHNVPSDQPVTFVSATYQNSSAQISSVTIGGEAMTRVRRQVSTGVVTDVWVKHMSSFGSKTVNVTFNSNPGQQIINAFSVWSAEELSQPLQYPNGDGFGSSVSDAGSPGVYGYNILAYGSGATPYTLSFMSATATNNSLYPAGDTTLVVKSSTANLYSAIGFEANPPIGSTSSYVPHNWTTLRNLPWSAVGVSVSYE